MAFRRNARQTPNLAPSGSRILSVRTRRRVATSFERWSDVVAGVRLSPPGPVPDMERSMRLAILVCGVLSAGYAQAATISVQSAGPEKPALVVVQGTLNAIDGERFFAKTAPLTTAVVRFQSNGGSVVTGIQIGEMIRLKDFHTVVPAGARCASACALAWLGGTQRFMGPGARIGLHAAYDPKSGQVTGIGDALRVASLNGIGLPYTAVVYIAQAAPDSV